MRHVSALVKLVLMIVMIYHAPAEMRTSLTALAGLVVWTGVDLASD